MKVDVLLVARVTMNAGISAMKVAMLLRAQHGQMSGIDTLLVPAGVVNMVAGR
jgi:hypothetical protein